MAEQDSSRGRNPSDLFQVEDASPSISPVEKIVLPPEEQLKRRVQRLVLAAIAAALLLYLGYLVMGWIHANRVSSALDAVIEDATPSSIENALMLVRDDPDDRVRARLLATAAIGGDSDGLEEAKAILEKSTAENDPDERIARIYVLLAEGDARGAYAEAERPAKYVDQKDAFLRGRAMTAVARGQLSQALTDAASAAELHPEAPEPTALLAFATWRTQGADAALALLDTVERRTPAVQTLRARIVGIGQGNAAEALALTESVQEDTDATQVQRAWAQLVEGTLAYRAGAVGSASTHAREAAKTEALVDESLIVSTAQLLLALGQQDDAAKLLKRLSSGPSSDLSSRAHVIAWWYARAGDPKAGLATLSGAGLGPEKPVDSAFRALALAELATQASRDAERQRAETLYRRALDDPTWGIAATEALAQMLAEDGRADEAITVLETGLATYPNHLALVDAATETYLALGDISKADALTTAALEAFPEEGWAHGSRARVHLATRDPAAAAGELERAVALSTEDAGLHALRGDATRAVGDTHAAAASYEEALDLQPTEPRALSGLLGLSIDMGDFTQAADVMKKMDDANVRSLRADQQRLRYLVRTGAGQSGVSQMRDAVARHGKNEGLRLVGARIYLQAEQYSNASSYFQQAKRLGADPRTAETGLALAQAYARRRLGAEKTLERAAEVPKDATEPPPPPSTWVQATELVVKAHLALADEKRGLAVRYGRRASELVPNDADVFLLLADIEEDRERASDAELRRASSAPIPMPVALGRLAVQLGPTEEGCRAAKAYLSANRNGKFGRKARDVTRQCSANEP
ncbi:MAG: hypothetical protein WBG86_05190 [Polyangiales bacterium]